MSKVRNIRNKFRRQLMFTEAVWMEHNQNTIAAIDQQPTKRIKFHDRSWFSIRRWPL